MALNTTNLFPWREIRQVTIGGEEMTFIPKFYVRNASYNEMPAFFVCGYPKTGYHIHPAFVNNGVVVDHGVLIGRYRAKGSYGNLVTTSDGSDYQSVTPIYLKESIEAKNTDPLSADHSGWHALNIYEHAMMVRLNFIKYAGTGDAMRHDAMFSVTSNIAWLDGINITPDADNNCYHCSILNNTQTGYVDIPVTLSGTSAYIRDMADAVGNGYDLGDVFLPKSQMSNDSGIYGAYGAYIESVTPQNYSEYAIATRATGIGLAVVKINSGNLKYGVIAKFC